MAEDIVAAAAEAVAREVAGPFPRTALVLGSGLGPFADAMEIDSVVPYDRIPGFPSSTVQGHAGRLVIGRAGGTPLVCMQGRMHLYEGYEPARLAVSVRTLKRLGVETLVLTNAAGGLNPAFGPGTIMIMDDHINLSGANPLIGPNDDRVGPRFVDMTDAYDPELRRLLHEAAREAGVPVQSGVYLQVAGPNFETPAEVRAYRILGADAVGMSTVPETLVARHAGMRVAGISVITNLAAGLAGHALSHAETIEEAGKAFDGMSRLLNGFLGKLSAA
jgi:inosine/guanosine/xanthosine phosphorylase family protein